MYNEQKGYAMRKIIITDKIDLKGKISGNWYHKLPLFLKGGLTSKRRKFLCRISGLGTRIKTRWYRLTGREIIPTFERVCNPSIKWSDIKERRFKIERY